MEADRRQLIFLCFSQFGVAFSFNFVNIFLPFFILNISPYSSGQTLLWIGAILGSTSIVTALTSTFWGTLTHHFRPKSLYLKGILLHGLLFFLMGFTTDLHLLLLLRILQGLIGGTSTIGLIIISSSSPREKVTSYLGIYQSSMTLGQLVGPPLGSFAAALFGFKGAFISASLVMFASLIFCIFYVADVPILPKKEKSSFRFYVDKRLLIGWFLCFISQLQLMFLPSILPNVFEKFQMARPVALKFAGIVVMIYTTTAMIGTYLWSWVSRKYGVYRMIIFLLSLGVLFQALLAFSQGIVDFTIIRMIQTGLVAVVLPLSISLFVSDLRGSTIGFLNSARFTGNAMGPVIATSILAVSNLPTLFLVISGISFVGLLSFKIVFKKE
ncbi:MAG: multidrug efflux MFS transporter [Deltaproteobacteria bacterium]|nr:multidrug efflux MFS transporter [Deltaproteobacteria bacterium]